MRRRPLSLVPTPSLVTLALAALLVACSGDDTPAPGAPGGGTADASTGPTTTGADAAVDTSTTAPGPVVDASAPVVDSGAPPVADASTLPADAAAPPCTGANKICLTLKVPTTVVPANVVKLYIGFSTTQGGFPEIGKGTTIQPVTMVPGSVMPFTIENKGLSGAYFVNAGLYMQGGGAAAPKAGVDFSASTSHAQTITSAATPLDEQLVLELAH